MEVPHGGAKAGPTFLELDSHGAAPLVPTARRIIMGSKKRRRHICGAMSTDP